MTKQSSFRRDTRETSTEELFISLTIPRNVGGGGGDIQRLLRNATLRPVAIVCPARLRRHGRYNGLQKFEACVSSDNAATPILKEAVKKDAVVLAEVLLDDGAIQIHNKPFIDKDQVCVFLHMKYNDLWERLWLSNEPIIILFYVRR